MKSLFLFLLLPFCAFSQIKLEGKVIDAATKQPVPYVNLELSATNETFQTNEAGAFLIHSAKGILSDTIIVSRLGYQPLYGFVKQISSQKEIELQPISFLLNEVRIANGKREEVEVGVTSKSGHKWASHFKQVPELTHAVYLRAVDGKVAFLKNIHFYMGDEEIEAPFLVNFHKNERGRLGEGFLKEDLKLVAYRKSSWNAFDVTLNGLVIPKEGIWVVIKWIADEKHKMKKVIKTRLVDGKVVNRDHFYYGPEIVQRFGTKHGLTYVGDGAKLEVAQKVW